MIILWILPRAVNSGPHIFCVIFSSGIKEANIQPWGLHVYIEYNMIEELRLPRESIFLSTGFPGFSLRKSLWTEETDSGDKLGARLNAEELTDGRREVIGLAD
jgi:hypothetical protein